MAAKGTVEEGAAVTNQYRLEIDGMPEIFFTSVGELSRELQIANMADDTNQSTGRVLTGETDVAQYVHHDAERVAMEAWMQAAVDGAPGYKRDGEIHLLEASGQIVASYELQGLICRMRKTPALAQGEDGSGVVLTWTLAYDDVLPL